MTDPGPATRRLIELTGGPPPRNLAPPEKSGTAKGDGLYCYWRRSPHHPTEPSYVKKAPAWPIYFKKVSGQKWESLAVEYGEFEDKWASGEEMVFDPFRHILMNGGAKEFPVAQIRELRWHRFPPRYVQKDGTILTITFPQLKLTEDGDVIDEAGRVLKDFRCPDCPAEEPSSWMLSEVGLRKHQKVQHSEIAGSRQQANDFAKAIQGQNQPIQEAIGLMTQLLAHLTAEQRAAVMQNLGAAEEPPKRGRKPKAQETDDAA